MTNYQQGLFTDLIDVNWMIEENKENKAMRRFLSIAYHKIQDDLRESMGDDKYNTFLRAGREMFAPAKG
jgi:hypothetical protein